MTTKLHEVDFYAWTRQQADALRNEDFEALDLANLIEEIEDMGSSKQDALESRLEVLLRHLLKLLCLPNSNPARGWRLTVREQRRQIARILRKNPSLRPLVTELIGDVYADAYEGASDDLEFDDLGEVALPVRCPWTVEQVLDLDWLP